MKKLSLLGCLAAFAVAGAFAQTSSKPDNKEFYLVGAMNGWELPAYGGNQYVLTDTDGDGIFEGHFDIPAGQCEFKIFTTAADEWDPEVYYGMYAYDPICLFKDERPRTTLAKGLGSANINISNWAGGTLDVQLSWAGVEGGDIWYLEMTIDGANQPQRPPVPELYLIGDFNDWQLPTAASDNNAKSPVENASNLFGYTIEIDMDLAPQNFEFALCRFDRETGKYYFFNIDNYCPLTLYAYQTDNGIRRFPSASQYGRWMEGTDPKEAAVTVNDWKGGELYVFIYYPLSTIAMPYISFYSPDTPITDFPEQLYYIIERDGEKNIYPCDFFSADYGYEFYIWAQSANGPVSITVTSENSLDPAPENCWGVAKSLADIGMSGTDTFKRMPLVKGGAPFRYDFKYAGKMTVTFNFPLSISTVNLEFMGGPIETKKLYVCGNVEKDGVANDFTSPSKANEELYDKYFRLEETSEGVFEGTYLVKEKAGADYSYFPDDLPQFRFFTDLGGWTRDYSVGSSSEDFFCMPIDLASGSAEAQLVRNGLGNWGPCIGNVWKDAYLKLIVDLNANTVRMEITDSGVDQIASDQAVEERWFNLQGLPVEHPEHGLYIRIVNGTSSLHMVR